MREIIASIFWVFNCEDASYKGVSDSETKLINREIIEGDLLGSLLKSKNHLKIMQNTMYPKVQHIKTN